MEEKKENPTYKLARDILAYYDSESGLALIRTLREILNLPQTKMESD